MKTYEVTVQQTRSTTARVVARDQYQAHMLALEIDEARYEWEEGEPSIWQIREAEFRPGLYETEIGLRELEEMPGERQWRS